ncbi:MAG: mandelate racemase/muconate lactonizing enzyme family protein [Proteobacteria bacterium]|nr:mandelate racemase/muconate lactonizing enzyme family protein [Pseudomonadota bacterium]
MKIKSLKASIHRIPLIVPLLEDGALKRDMVFCEVETDDGIIGWGVTGNYLSAAVVAALEKHIFPVVEGMDPRDTEAIHWAVWWKLNPRAMTGVISNALSALDIALWDIHGKQAGRTVAQLLGGHRDWATTYITFGLHQYDRDQLVECAKMFVAEGNNALKMVVAVDKGGWREDARRIRAVRDAVGDDVELMIDANFIFTPVEARMLCRAIEDCDLTWFEEPLHQNDARALRDLRRYTRIPIAAGQNEGHRWRHRDLVENQAVDILQPNCCYNGGYTETRKIAHMAQAYNLPIANGAGWPVFNMHTMAGLMNGGSVEFHVATGYMGSVVFDNTPSPENNRVKIPDAPGLGFEANYDVLRDTRIEVS